MSKPTTALATILNRRDWVMFPVLALFGYPSEQG